MVSRKVHRGRPNGVPEARDRSAAAGFSNVCASLVHLYGRSCHAERGGASRSFADESLSRESLRQGRLWRDRAVDRLHVLTRVVRRLAVANSLGIFRHGNYAVADRSPNLV
jgi:hypothetical protein